MTKSILTLIILTAIAFNIDFKSEAQRRRPTPAPALPEKPELVIQNGHSDTVRAVAFSPDGRTFASAGADETVRVWEAETGRLIRTLEGHFDDVTCLAFSPDGKLIASGSLDKNVKVWDLANGKMIRSLADHEDAVNAVAFSPDGKLVSSGSRDDTINVWDLAGNLKLTIESECGQVRSVAFSPDGKTIAGGCIDKTIRIWNSTDGNLVINFPAHSSEVSSIAFSRDGRLLLSGSADRSAKLWNPVTGEMLRQFKGHGGGVVSVAFSPDGKTVASGSQDRSVRLWETETGRQIRSLDGYPSPVTSIAFSPDGQTIAAGTWRIIWQWNITSGKVTRAFDSHSWIARKAIFSPDGQMVASTSAKTVRLWDSSTGRSIKSLEGHAGEVSSVAFSPDSKMLASASWDRTVKLWDLQTGRAVRSFDGHSQEVSSVAFSPDGKTLATASFDKTIRLWNPSTGKRISTLEGHHSIVSEIAFSADGRKLVSASVDATVKVWDVASAKTIRTLQGHTSQVNSVAFSPDGRTVASGGADKTVRVWNAETGETIRSTQAHTYDVLAVAFSPDGKIVASGGFDRAIKLWDAQTGALAKTLEGHASPVNSLAFSPDGKYLVSGSHDTTARIWAMDASRYLSALLALNEREWIAFTADGFYDGSDGSARYVGWRVGNRVIEFDQLFDRFFHPEAISQMLGGDTPAPTAKPADSILKGFTLPPEVRITSPRRDERFSAEEVEVRVEAKDIGGGVEEIRLFQNGKLVDPAQRGLKVVQGRQVSTTYRVLLTEGDNVLRAVALNKDRTESLPFDVTVRLGAPEKSAALHMLVVGINRYKNSALNLNFASPDAQGIADFFRQRGSRLFSNITITGIYDEEATRQNILAGFQKLAQAAQPQDVVIIYFAGHGDTRGSQWYFVPYEVTQPEKDQALIAGGISSKTISDNLVRVRSQKVLMLFDACRSGKAVTEFRGYEDRRSLAQLARSTGVHVVAASTRDQLAAEVKDLNHGVFTYVLLKGLGGEAATGGSKTPVTVRGLLAYVEYQLPEISKKYRTEAQYPVSSSKGMDFPLAIAQ